MAGDSAGNHRRRYDSRAFEAEVGGEEIRVAPLRGLEAMEAFQDAVVEEVLHLKDEVEKHAREGGKISPEALLMRGVDLTRLLKLGLPEVITDELLARTTLQERQGLLEDVLVINNLGRFAPFVSPELILEISMRLSREAPGFPIPEPTSNSSEPEPAGARSASS